MVLVEARTWFLKGNSLLRLGNYKKARDCYGESLKINSADADTWLNKGICYHNLENYKEANQPILPKHGMQRV
jgi:tetratricopeptide (TPR) repeat protein